jgi:ABC-type sugar transport system ATPase subunit
VETRRSTVILTSSDFEDLHAICHRVLVIREGRLVAELTGENKTVERMIEHSYLTEEAA